MKAPTSEKASYLHALAIQFRGFAAATLWPGYRARMLEMAEELDRAAGYRECPGPPSESGSSRAG